jgi:hypothetical protein
MIIFEVGPKNIESFFFFLGLEDGIKDPIKSLALPISFIEHIQRLI